MATSVKTEAHTDIPCTRPLTLHTALLKGQPVKSVKKIKRNDYLVKVPKSDKKKDIWRCAPPYDNV